MARHTSWRVGGAAELFVRPADLSELRYWIQQERPVHWIGFGSNLLVRDGGIRGVVIAPSKGMAAIERIGERVIRAQAAVAGAKLARFAAQQGLVGLEFLATVPGTVGGALAMNAGAMGSEMWDHVIKVHTLDRTGALHERRPDAYEIGYRSVKTIHDAREWFFACDLELQQGDGAASLQRVKALQQERSSKQPIGVASCGSVFRNPEGDYAGRLIDAAGLKGLRIGQAEVSRKHANFIINLGGARAAEIEALMSQIQQRVYEQSGVWLESEVRVVGETG